MGGKTFRMPPPKKTSDSAHTVFLSPIFFGKGIALEREIILALYLSCFPRSTPGVSALLRWLNFNASWLQDGFGKSFTSKTRGMNKADGFVSGGSEKCFAKKTAFLGKVLPCHVMISRHFACQDIILLNVWKNECSWANCQVPSVSNCACSTEESIAVSWHMLRTASLWHLHRPPHRCI